MKTLPNYWESFSLRHGAPTPERIGPMLRVINARSLDELIDQTIPADLRRKTSLKLPEPESEFTFLKRFKKLIDQNKVFKSYIGMGYYGSIMPPVLLRNILENPSWYTSYTPYQAEVAQGRLEALINFQTLVVDLTGMEIANASLLDEATAAAEAMGMLHGEELDKGGKRQTFLVDSRVFPQTLSVLQTHAAALGIELRVAPAEKQDLTDPSLFGLYIQNPDVDGALADHSSLIASAQERGIGVALGTDLMACLLLKSPGEMGVDIAVGSSQRLGIPMGFGGPHAAFFATRDKYKRRIPGRIIGVSLDAQNNPCYRMALQAREQHIRRERATSNICTAQALLANLAGMYAVYHGPEGLKKIALRIHGLAQALEKSLQEMNIRQVNRHYFDTIKVEFFRQEELRKEALAERINFRYIDNTHVGIALDETTSPSDIAQIVALFARASGKTASKPVFEERPMAWPASWIRPSAYLAHPTFNTYHTEHEMLRYIKRLEGKDISLAHSMIPIGSCTMKLNATTEMIPLTWPHMSHIHPFAPADQAKGYAEMIKGLEAQLMEITQMTGVSLQPNSGAQGEYAGLMVIRGYHASRGEAHRRVALIPASAHGTNPASAVKAGLRVVVVKSDEEGKIDVEDLKAKANTHRDNLCCLMVTYPSTHGVFEGSIRLICDYIHQCGGMVYMDGANMNAQIGLTSPALIGADVCHLNLHKTLCIPHGGGGPGMGPICVNDKLKPFLPSHPVTPVGGEKAISAIAAAAWGSASVLCIPYAYICLMGGKGLTEATKLAILNANYVKDRLAAHYPILYTGAKGRCAHEMILDCRTFKKAGIEVEDIAKRLIDYSFHAPTVSFPVAGTLMFEPTESESKEELDRFCDALIAIRQEIREVEQGIADSKDNVLKHAPHTAAVVTADRWERPYSRQQAAYPLPYVQERKFWSPVGRADNAYGDRNLICTCAPIEEYAAAEG